MQKRVFFFLSLNTRELMLRWICCTLRGIKEESQGTNLSKKKGKIQSSTFTKCTDRLRFTPVFLLYPCFFIISLQVDICQFHILTVDAERNRCKGDQTKKLKKNEKINKSWQEKHATLQKRVDPVAYFKIYVDKEKN